MDIESKIWTWTNVGTKKHAFIDGVALCRKNITRNPESVATHGMDYCAAKGASICTGCDRKFNAAIEREEACQKRLTASMQPSTGEGDYLPPAEAATQGPVCPVCQQVPSGCTCFGKMPSAEAVTEVPAPEIVCVCPRMEPPAKFGHHVVCPLRATDTNREDTMNERRRTDGPPSGIQVKILDRLLLGERQKEMAADMGYSESYVSAELSLAASKLRARTTAQAAALWATANAYREAADLIDGNRMLQPDNEVDQHVDQVMARLADLLRTRAARLGPA